jgi:hypothetical protein
MSNVKTVLFIFVLGPQNSYQKLHHICFTFKFVEQIFSFPHSESEFVWEIPLGLIQILSTPLSLKYKFTEQNCNQTCSTVKYIEQK